MNAKSPGGRLRTRAPPAVTAAFENSRQTARCEHSARRAPEIKDRLCRHRGPDAVCGTLRPRSAGTAGGAHVRASCSWGDTSTSTDGEDTRGHPTAPAVFADAVGGARGTAAGPPRLGAGRGARVNGRAFPVPAKRFAPPDIAAKRCENPGLRLGVGSVAHGSWATPSLQRFPSRKPRALFRLPVFRRVSPPPCPNGLPAPRTGPPIGSPRMSAPSWELISSSLRVFGERFLPGPHL